MKKTIKFLMALASLAIIFVACSSDITDENNKEGNDKQLMRFTATQEATQKTPDMLSRTTISERTINWTTDDKITIWDGTSKNEFTAIPGTPATSATLTGTAKSSGTFTAVYPHSVGSNCTFSGLSVSGIEIPKNQIATANSYDPAAAIMTAYTTNYELAFKNACSFLKLTTSEAYTKIVISVTTGYIAGTFSITDATSPTLTCTTGMPMIALKPSSGTTIAAGTYYIAIAPGTFGGLKMDCYTDDNNYIERIKASEVTFVRNKVYNMGSTESGWTAHTDSHTSVDLGLSVKWATCNIGAANDTEHGNRYAWAETVTKSTDHSWSDYKYGTSSSALTKYNATDKKTTLELCDDAANVNWGGSWRMPTQAEIQELIDNTEWRHTGNGYYKYGKKEGYTENYIYFRAGSGCRRNGYWFNTGETSYFWSSSLYGIGTSNAYSLRVGKYSAGWNDYYYNRTDGILIRPVCP